MLIIFLAFRYCLLVVETFNNAEASYNDGHREQAYVLFMRVLHIFERIQMTPQYQEKEVKHDAATLFAKAKIL